MGDAAAAPATPDEVVTAFAAAFNARDAVAIASLYASDAELMRPDAPPVKGREAIEAAFRRGFTEVRVLDLLSMHSQVSGSLAYVTGTLTLSTRTRQHGAEIAAGNYLVVMRRAAGRWTIVSHMYTLPLRPDFVG